MTTKSLLTNELPYAQKETSGQNIKLRQFDKLK